MKNLACPIYCHTPDAGYWMPDGSQASTLIPHSASSPVFDTKANKQKTIGSIPLEKFVRVKKSCHAVHSRVISRPVNLMRLFISADIIQPDVTWKKAAINSAKRESAA